MHQHEFDPDSIDDSAMLLRGRAIKRCRDKALFDGLHEGVLTHTRHRKRRNFS